MSPKIRKDQTDHIAAAVDIAGQRDSKAADSDAPPPQDIMADVPRNLPEPERRANGQAGEIAARLAANGQTYAPEEIAEALRQAEQLERIDLVPSLEESEAERDGLNVEAWIDHHRGRGYEVVDEITHWTSGCADCEDRTGDPGSGDNHISKDGSDFDCRRCNADGVGSKHITRLRRAVGGRVHGSKGGRPASPVPLFKVSYGGVMKALAFLGVKLRWNRRASSYCLAVADDAAPWMLPEPAVDGECADSESAADGYPPKETGPRDNPYEMEGLARDMASLGGYPDSGEMRENLREFVRDGETMALIADVVGIPPRPREHLSDAMLDGLREILEGSFDKASGKNRKPYELSDNKWNRIVSIVRETEAFDPVADYWNALADHPSPVDDPAHFVAALFDADGKLSADAWRLLYEAVRVLLASVYWRTMQPGCKLDTVLILAGEPGGGKTKLGDLLAPPGTHCGNVRLDAEQSRSARDTLIEMHSMGIVRFDEMAGIRFDRIDGAKALLTGEHDTWTFKYDRQPYHAKRAFACYGTMNFSKRLPWDKGLQRRLLIADVGTPIHETNGGVPLTDILTADVRDGIWAGVKRLCETDSAWQPRGEGIPVSGEARRAAQQNYVRHLSDAAKDARRAELSRGTP